MFMILTLKDFGFGAIPIAVPMILRALSSFNWRNSKWAYLGCQLTLAKSSMISLGCRNWSRKATYWGIEVTGGSHVPDFWKGESLVRNQLETGFVYLADPLSILEDEMCAVTRCYQQKYIHLTSRIRWELPESFSYLGFRLFKRCIAQP